MTIFERAGEQRARRLVASDDRRHDRGETGSAERDAAAFNARVGTTEVMVGTGINLCVRLLAWTRGRSASSSSSTFQ